MHVWSLVLDHGRVACNIWGYSESLPGARGTLVDAFINFTMAFATSQICRCPPIPYWTQPTRRWSRMLLQSPQDLGDESKDMKHELRQLSYINYILYTSIYYIYTKNMTSVIRLLRVLRWTRLTSPGMQPESLVESITVHRCRELQHTYRNFLHSLFFLHSYERRSKLITWVKVKVSLVKVPYR